MAGEWIRWWCGRCLPSWRNTQIFQWFLFFLCQLPFGSWEQDVLQQKRGKLNLPFNSAGLEGKSNSFRVLDGTKKCSIWGNYFETYKVQLVWSHINARVLGTRNLVSQGPSDSHVWRSWLRLKIDFIQTQIENLRWLKKNKQRNKISQTLVSKGWSLKKKLLERRWKVFKET